jgi:putative acetyltransferase
MKRLFVRPEFRGARIGGRLAEGIVSEAKRIGYATMRLDTLNTLKEACSLYRRLGFREIPPYYENPLEGVVYFEKDLEAVR